MCDSSSEKSTTGSRRVVSACLATAATVGLVASLVFGRQLKKIEATKKREAKRKGELALELMSIRNSMFESRESLERGTYPKFITRPGDVFIVTYPKCGTTWVQHILHGLRSGGSMEFGEITEVSPWDTIAHLLGQNVNDEQRDAAGVVHTPRLFKSHEPFEKVGRTEGCSNSAVGEAK